MSVTRRHIIRMAGALMALPAVPVVAQILNRRRGAPTTGIDAVRNYTMTTGVGNFVLGAAASGCRCLKSAVKTGDSFYYSVVGIDKPAELEVGRGTMHSNGTIEREALGAAATDFSAGYKTITLLGVGELCAAIEAAAAAGPIPMPSRDAIAMLADVSKPVLLQEPGRTGIFTFEPGNLSALVSVDPRRGIYIAPARAPDGASGAWIRKFEGPVMAHWFGTEADGAANDYPALSAALNAAATHPAKSVQLPAGTYSIRGTPLSVPDGVTIEGSGPETFIVADDAAVWAFYMNGRTGATIRNMRVEGSNNVANGVWRSAIKFDNCIRCRVENVRATPAASTLLYMWDCDYCVADTLYYDGGARQNYYGAYLVGCKACRIVNSVAVNCFQGFALSGAGTDPGVTRRSIAQTYGNSIENCYVRNCRTQAFNINSSTFNTISNCRAEDYAGKSIHKAFQVKDAVGFEGQSRGNVFTGCTVTNYPAGFGVVRSSGARFLACTGRNLSTNGIELVEAVDCQFIGCNLYEFRQAGIWTSSGTSRCRFDTIALDTSTPAAIGILITSKGGTDKDNDFDNVVTNSRLAAFVEVAAGARNNRFGSGCRPNGNPIVDSSRTSRWPPGLATKASVA